MRNYWSTGSERGDPGRQKIYFFSENFCWQFQEYLLNSNKMSRDLNAVNPVRKKLWQRRARERKEREKHRAFMLKKDYNYIDKLSDKLPTRFSALGGSLFCPVTPYFWLLCDPPRGTKYSLHACAPHKIDPPPRTYPTISCLIKYENHTNGHRQRAKL